MKIKRIAALLLAGIMSVGLCSCASSNTSSASESSSAAESNADSSAADSTDSTASEGGDWQYIADKGNFVAGITLFEPMNYYDENGELTGFETEFTKAVCEKLGVEAKFQEIEWDKKEIELNAKTIDAIWNGLTVTEERKENMGFSKSYVRNKQVVVIKADNKDKYTDEASMAGASCAAESGSAGQTAIDYSDLMIVEGVELAPEEYAIGMRKGDTETIEKVNGAIDELVADGTLKALAEKYGLADVYAFDN